MAIVASDWTVTRSNGNIRYIGDDHGGTAPSYATVIEFHRWLQGLADDASSSGDDELDITDLDPSARSTDNIITLKGSYNIDATAAEHLYDGSIIQNSGDDIWDGIVNFGSPNVVIQLHQNGAVLADDWWNYNVVGTHTGAADQAVLTDSGASWTTDEWVGYLIKNTTDGSQGIITANTATTITTSLSGGTDNDWDTSDAYVIGQGLNGSSIQGISHRFMIKVRTAGTDIDNRILLGISRIFGNTYSEFSINGTSRGNNVLALSTTDDLNNTNSLSTVAGWAGITLTTEGYVGIDVDNNGSNEFYYSQWNADTPTRTINEFYERMKWLTRDGTSSTLYGLSGELFRGITHQVNLNTAGTNSGTFSAFEAVSWTGGTGQMLAIDNTTAASANTMWIQLLTGSAPGVGVLITGGGSGATATTTASNATVARSISTPFIGVSTGSAIIGAYGVGIETNDLSASDKVFDLTNTQITPPNNVTFTVAGLVSTEDRVLVAPWDGVTTDGNGDPAIDQNQLSLNATLNTDNITSVVVSTAIPSDTPSTGTIRVVDNNGFDRRLEYSSWTGSTFTITTTDGQEDFATVNATAGNDVYITYIDVTASASTASFTGVYSSDRDLVVFVRDGGGTPIKQFVTSAVFGSSNTTVTAIRTTDL